MRLAAPLLLQHLVPQLLHLSTNLIPPLHHLFLGKEGGLGHSDGTLLGPTLAPGQGGT